MQSGSISSKWWICIILWNDDVYPITLIGSKWQSATFHDKEVGAVSRRRWLTPSTKQSNTQGWWLEVRNPSEQLFIHSPVIRLNTSTWFSVPAPVSATLRHVFSRRCICRYYGTWKSNTPPRIWTWICVSKYIEPWLVWRVRSRRIRRMCTPSIRKIEAQLFLCNRPESMLFTLKRWGKYVAYDP